MSLYDYILRSLIHFNTLTAYDAGSPIAPDDSFTKELAKQDIFERLATEEVIDVYDDFGDVIGTQKVYDTLKAADVKYYEIKEEWCFEKQKSVMEVRIIGIKSVAEIQDPSGEPTLTDLFWLYMPELRYTLANSFMFNPHNDAEMLSYDGVFTKRKFESTIIKESNVYDRFISAYKTGLDALLEAEMAEERIFNFEQDLWHY